MNQYQFFIEVAILVATIVAIIYGPIKAVKITREEDKRHEDRTRKYNILSDLMKTRRARIDPIHVAALNLIELEFYGCKDIKKAYQDYAKNLTPPFPRETEELGRHLDDGDQLFLELLRQIATELGFSFDKADLDRLGYLPQGLSSHHDNSMMNAHLLREVLEGKRPIQISNFIQNDGIFPPAPKNKPIEDNSEDHQ